ASLGHRDAVELSVLMGLTAMLLLVILAEAIMLVASSRAITAPLSILAQEADDLAARRLPEAMARIGGRGEQHVPLQPVRVPNGASTEILRVARALDNLQQAAYGLAIEQAVVRRNTTESLANLGRRNQNLIRRQLGFISQLEREESDPSELANLFELDHLATRMRRNAESLLVLAGKTSPRRHAEPVALVDVIRAAVGEVEEYRRVELRRIDG